MQFIGYHGTSERNAKNILSNGFKKSDKGWLGSGVYLFENNDRLALFFAMNVKSFKNPAVLKCFIRIDESELLDLTDPNKTGCLEFHETRLDFMKSLKKAQFDVTIDKKKFDSIIIDILCETKGYHIVRKHTYTGNIIDRQCQIFSFVPNGTELCVKDTVCIIKTENLKLGELSDEQINIWF